MVAKNPYLSVIIPAVNESARLPLTLVDIDRHLSKARYTYDILVVDGGSTDATLDIAKRFTKMISNLTVLESERSFGIGGALKKGMLSAGGKYKLFMEADNSTSIDQFKNIIPLLNEKYDVVVGSRYLKDSKISPSKSIARRAVDGLGRLFIAATFFLRIKDTQCGFKCFSENVASSIFGLQKAKGWAFNIEVLALSKKLGYKVGEIPVIWINDKRSRANLVGYIKTFVEVLKIRYFFWRDVYRIRER